MVTRRGLSGALLALIGLVMMAVLVASLACAAAEPTPTSVPLAPPAPPVAPTVAPAPIPTLAPTASTPGAPQPTPTRGVPTPTPVSKDQIRYGGVLRVITGGDTDIQTLVPGYAASFYARPHFYAMGNTLLRYAPDFSLHPELAESWNISADGRAITFNLRKGVKFHDGSPFNAQVVKWNMDLILDRANAPVLDPKLQGVTPYLDLVPFVEKVQVVDENTISFALKSPFRPFLAWMGDMQGFVILSPVAAQKYGTELVKRFIGTGPFKFSEFIPDQHLKVVKNQDYWEKGKPYLDGATWLRIPETSVQLAMLRTGEVDLNEIDARDLGLVQRSPGLKLDPYESSTFDALQFRVTKEPWTKKAIRQAVAYGVDSKKVIDVLYSKAGRVAYSSEGDKLWWSDPTIKIYDYDLKKAKEKMVEAGFPGGITVKMGCSTTAFNIQQCEFFQAMLKEVGINIVVEPTKTLYVDMLQGKVDFRIAPGWSPRADPDTRLRIIHHSKGSNFALTEYNSPEIDRLLDEAVQVYDQSKAKEIYGRVQRIATEDASWVFIVLLSRYMGLQSYAQNHVWYQDGYLRVRDIWLQR